MRTLLGLKVYSVWIYIYIYIYIKAKVSIKGLRTFKEIPATHKHNNLQKIKPKTTISLKSKPNINETQKLNLNLLKSRSMVEKPRATAKGGGDDKSSNNWGFTYCLNFHYHTTTSLPTTTTISP